MSFPDYLHFNYALMYKDSSNKFGGLKIIFGYFYLPSL